MFSRYRSKKYLVISYLNCVIIKFLNISFCVLSYSTVFYIFYVATVIKMLNKRLVDICVLRIILGKQAA